MEIRAEVILKGTKVDGVYDSDPSQNAKAKLFERLTYLQVLEKGLKVMDATAFALCREHSLPIRIFNFSEPGALKRIVVS